MLVNFNPDSHSRTIWKCLVLRDHLGTLGGHSESFGTATWLKNIVRKALDYPLAFLGKGTWLKSIVLKERLTIPDYLLRHPVWIHLVVPTANWESNHSPLGVAYDHQATTPSVSLLGSRLATRLAHGGVLGCILTASVYPKLKYLNSSCGGLALPLNGPSKSTYLYYSSYWGRLCFAMNNPMACHRIKVIYHLRLFIDLEQREVVGVNIQRTNVYLWVLEIVLAFVLIVVDLLPPATERVRERRDLAVCIFLVEWDAETESDEHWPIGHL